MYYSYFIIYSGNSKTTNKTMMIYKDQTCFFCLCALILLTSNLNFFHVKISYIKKTVRERNLNDFTNGNTTE